MPAPDWFQQLTGFAEVDGDHTRSHLAVEGSELVSRVNGRRWGIGTLAWPTLDTLRATPLPRAARSTVRTLVGEARALHAEPALAGALFQVASQFNLLEMTAPRITPEQGVTRYRHDPTQGPACAIACGAATIYRNDFVPLEGGIGQTATRQIDTLAPLGDALAAALALSVASLWHMRNGYAMCRAAGLEAVAEHLAALDEPGRDALRGRLAMGWHRDVEVTDAPGTRVSQVFCSALPVAYAGALDAPWAPLATLVLEAAYEATLRIAAAQAAAGGSTIVLLTRVGGGAFGNDDAWIDRAIGRALTIVEHAGLDVRLVDHGVENPSSRAIVRAWRQPPSASPA